MLRSLRAVIREMHSTKERLLKFTYKCTPPPSQLTCYRQLSTHSIQICLQQWEIIPVLLVLQCI